VFGISYLAGAKFHSSRLTKKMKTKHMKEQKTLYTQYYNDVYKLEEQKQEQQNGELRGSIIRVPGPFFVESLAHTS